MCSIISYLNFSFKLKDVRTKIIEMSGGGKVSPDVVFLSVDTLLVVVEWETVVVLSLHVHELDLEFTFGMN